MKHYLSRIAFIALFATMACKDKEPEPEAPVVVTGDLFTITGRGTLISGTVTSEGGYKLTEIGVVYGTSSSPTTDDIKEKIDMTEVTGYPHEYSVLVRNGLPTGTVYFRTYVTGGGKTFYGETKRKN